MAKMAIAARAILLACERFCWLRIGLGRAQSLAEVLHLREDELYLDSGLGCQEGGEARAIDVKRLMQTSWRPPGCTPLYRHLPSASQSIPEVENLNC